MEILRTISLYTEGKNLPFLVIGGHAVNAYGIMRQTTQTEITDEELKALCERYASIELFDKIRRSR